jgi:hypothetical protein
MKGFKCIIIAILIILFILPASATKRRERESMAQLTDSDSPYYVPFPYPKNRTELIADIKYYYIDLTKNAKSAFIGGTPPHKIITKDLFSPNPKYKIGKIVKVKNNIDYLPDDYYWLVYVMDSQGDAVMRIAMQASGLGLMGSTIDKNEFMWLSEESKKSVIKSMKVLEEKDIKKYLSESLEDTAIDGKIKKIERLGIKGKIGDFTSPLWQIIMKDGAIYYYSERQDQVYSISEERSWKKDNRGLRKRPALDWENPWDFIPDRINDKLIILKRLPKKKQ